MRASVPRPFWILGAGVALMLVGSLGPWGKAIFVTDYGLDRHGAVVMVAAIVIAALLGLHLRRPRRSWPPIAAAAVAAISAAIAASDFRDLVDDPFVGPAWGLYAAFAGCALVVALSMALLARPPSRTAASPEPETETEPETELSPPAGRSR
jgi:peptidoglycan/LPS O-acetylase OafA/YrhL